MGPSPAMFLLCMVRINTSSNKVSLISCCRCFSKILRDLLHIIVSPGIGYNTYNSILHTFLTCAFLSLSVFGVTVKKLIVLESWENKNWKCGSRYDAHIKSQDCADSTKTTGVASLWTWLVGGITDLRLHNLEKRKCSQACDNTFEQFLIKLLYTSILRIHSLPSDLTLVYHRDGTRGKWLIGCFIFVVIRRLLLDQNKVWFILYD